MTPSEALIMASLRDHHDQPLTLRDLQARAGICETSVRGSANALVARGMIERRRAAAFALTRLGRRYVATKRGRAVLDTPVADG